MHSVRHHPVYSALYPVRRERACIQPWIECNDRVENRLSTCFHHAFTDYANAVAAAGLAIDEAREPLPPQRRKEASPERCDRFVETPCVLILKLSAR